MEWKNMEKLIPLSLMINCLINPGVSVGSDLILLTARQSTLISIIL